MSVMPASRAKALITENLADERIAAIGLFIEELIERKDHQNVVPRYRIRDSNGAHITDMDNFVANIKTSDLRISYPFKLAISRPERTIPFLISIGNYTVSLINTAVSDQQFIEIFGLGDKRILFTLNYVTDSDTTLPLKIINVTLVTVA